MSTQNTITTVVDPIVSARVGNDTFLSSVRTSVRNSFTVSIIRLNIALSHSSIISQENCRPVGTTAAHVSSSKLLNQNQIHQGVHPVALNHHMAPGTSELGV